MLNPQTNRRPLTRLARFGSLSLLMLVATVVASLQVAAVEQEPQTEPRGTTTRTLTIDGRNVNELVDRATALQEQMAAVLAELQTLLDGIDRRADGSNGTVRIGNGTVRIGNGVRPPRKIHDVPPAYPSAAREAGIEGLVLLDATIDPTGAVSDIEVLRSVPELDQAAIEAVEQWRWEPTLVDGEPVSILLTVTVNFTLRSR